MTIQDVFEAVGAHAAGRMTDQEFKTLEDHACPGAGACGGQFTANTMAIVCEALGIAALGSGSVPATAADKAAVARRAGEQVVRLVAVAHQAQIDHHAPRHRERDRRRRGDRRIDQRRAPPAGDRQRGGRRADDRRLRSHQRRDAAHRRLEAVGPLRRQRSARGRRQPARDEAARRVGRDRRRRADRDRPDAGRGSREGRRNAGPGGRAADRPAAQAARRPGDPLRQHCAGRRGPQALRDRTRRASRARARVRKRRGGIRSRAAADHQGRRCRGDSLRRPGRRTRACARCSA